MFHHVLCAVDGSDLALRGAAVAADLAAKYGAKLTILTVTKELKLNRKVREYIQLEQLSGEPQYILDSYTEEVIEKAKDAAVADGLDRKQVRVEVRSGNPARTIVDFAKKEKADCIVLGSRGHGDIEGVLLGSVSHKVNSLAKCTVVTVR
jgi:nucleotide-binding universal stress UspA family protein